MSGAMLPVYFNGKFYSGQLNGGHRVADRLIHEVDRQLARLPEHARPQASLFLPAKRSWGPDLKAIKLVEAPRARSQLWEQLVLPWRAWNGVLVNLCNLAPILHRRKLLMLHDAQFLLPDNSYPWRLRWGYRLLTPWMSRTSLKVLTVSTYSQQMLDLLRVAPRAMTEVVRNGADHLLAIRPEPRLPERLGLRPGGYVVHIASPKVYKNTAVLLDAFADPRLDDLKLVLVGVERHALERRGLRPPDQAVFVGGVSDAKLRSLYEGALCMAFPSRTEGFGLPPIEAMACGCPAVVSTGGAIPEVCHDAALYADMDDAESWVMAFMRLRDDRSLRAAKIAEGRERAADFTWQESGARLTDIIMKAARI